MDDANQIHVPASFIRLFVAPERPVPRERAATIAQRFEVCEDMATALEPQARTLQFQLGITEADVLDKLLDSLLTLSSGEGAVLSAPEARWVIGRLAEQLDWVAHLPADLLALAAEPHRP